MVRLDEETEEIESSHVVQQLVYEHEDGTLLGQHGERKKPLGEVVELKYDGPVTVQADEQLTILTFRGYAKVHIVERNGSKIAKIE